MLHFFFDDIRSKVSQLPHSYIILKIFSKCLTPREQQKLILARFNLENIISSFALKTGTVNNNLIITSMSLHPLLLGAIKLWPHVTRCKTPVRETVFFAYSINLCHCSKRLGIDTSIPAYFNEIRIYSHMEKKLFYIQYFFFV